MHLTNQHMYNFTGCANATPTVTSMKVEGGVIWTKNFSKREQKYYYVNTVTKISQWTVPKCFGLTAPVHGVPMDGPTAPAHGVHTAPVHGVPMDLEVAYHTSNDTTAPVKIGGNINHATVSGQDTRISLIQGPPGTGKTSAILGIISALLSRNSAHPPPPIPPSSSSSSSTSLAVPGNYVNT
jgi:hypothetical protein